MKFTTLIRSGALLAAATILPLSSCRKYYSSENYDNTYEYSHFDQLTADLRHAELQPQTRDDKANNRLRFKLYLDNSLKANISSIGDSYIKLLDMVVNLNQGETNKSSYKIEAGDKGFILTFESSPEAWNLIQQPDYLALGTPHCVSKQSAQIGR